MGETTTEDTDDPADGSEEPQVSEGGGADDEPELVDDNPESEGDSGESENESGDEGAGIGPDGPHFGDRCFDKEDDDPDEFIVLDVPGKTAAEWEVPDRDGMLSEDNPDYPKDSPVVVGSFRHLLDDRVPEWYRREDIHVREIHHMNLPSYAFPWARLERVDERIHEELLEKHGVEPKDDPSDGVDVPDDEDAEDDEAEPESGEADSESGPVDVPVYDLEAVGEALREEGFRSYVVEGDDGEDELLVKKPRHEYHVDETLAVEGDGKYRQHLLDVLDEIAAELDAE